MSGPLSATPLAGAVARRRPASGVRPSGGRPPSDEWMSQGACVGHSETTFFPDRDDSAEAALALCRTCSVRAECLAFAIEHKEHFGIWGGLTETERRRGRHLTVARR